RGRPVFDLVEVLAGWGGVVAGDAGAAETLRREADRTRDRLDGEVAEAVGAQLPGHPLLSGGGDPALGQVDERRGEELALVRHVDAVVARGNDRGTGDAEMDLARAAPIADLVDQRAHRRRSHDAVLNEEDPLAGEDLGQRRVFEPGLGGAVSRPLDEG